ncbi:unnamed protein product, partial [Trichobilharzia regenti]
MARLNATVVTSQQNCKQLHHVVVNHSLLISDRTMSCNESTLGNSPISSGLNPNFIGSSVDRTLNNCPTICSNITPSLCNTSTMSSNNPVGNVTTNLSTSNIVLGGIYSTDSSLQVPS